MNDINLIIEKAADELTRNERKMKGKKENYTESELKDILREQELQKERNRDGLEKKLNDMCEKTQREFKISHISAGMMQKVALQISKEIGNETITSLENVEKSGGVIKTLQEEATKIQIIENYEAIYEGRRPPHENIPYYSESTKIIVSNPEIAIALDLLNMKNETDMKVDDLVGIMNKDNANGIANQINEIKNSEKYKNEVEHRNNVAVRALQVAETQDEQRVVCEDIEHQEAAARCNLDPDNNQALIGLIHGYMTRLNLKNPPFDRILSDMKMHLLSNKKLTEAQRCELKNIIEEAEQNKNSQRILDFLADRIVELNPNISKEEALVAAQEAAKANLDPSRIDKNFLKAQARVLFREDKDYIDYCDLADSIYGLDENTQEFDWKKLEGLNGTTSDLYAMTLAALNQKTVGLEDKSYHQKTQELIEKYVKEEKYTVRNDMLYVKAKENGKAVEESSYWMFSKTVMENPESLESMKKSAIEHIKKSKDLSPEEKSEEISKIEQIKSVDDVIEYSIQGIAREKTKQGKKVDLDSIRAKLVGEKPKTHIEEQKDAAKKERKDKKAEATARTKASTQSKYYEKYIKTMDMLGHVKKDAEIEIDNELLDNLKIYVPEAYQELSSAYTSSSNHMLRDSMQRRLNDERRRERLQAKHIEEAEKSAEVKTQTIQRDEEKADDRQALQTKRLEDAVVVGDEEEVEGEGKKPVVLQAVEGVVEDVVSTLAEPTSLMGSAKKTKKIEEEELEI